MAEFLETPTFPVCPSFGYISQPDYSVSIIRTANGAEQRNANWSRPLSVYTITAVREESEIQLLLAFWHTVGGMFCGFRFKDWADYQSVPLGQTPSPTDQPVIVNTESPETWQLTKTYKAGARTQLREIYKPVQGTIMIADAGVLKSEGSDYTIDYTTGLVDLNFTPTNLTWGGEFDVPARFASEFPVELVNLRVESVQFVLQELRI